MKYQLFIALRYLMSKRRQKFISVTGMISILGVFIGVMALNVVLAVMGGFEEELRDKILGVSSHVAVMSYNGPIENFKQLKSEVSDYPGVVGSSPFIYSQAMLVTENSVSGTVVRGIDPNTAGEVTNIETAIGRGSINNIDAVQSKDNNLEKLGRIILSKLNEKTVSEKPPIIIGKELASILGVTVGDLVSLVSPFGKIGPFGPMAKTKNFELIAIFDYGMIEYDSSVSYMKLEDAMDYFELENKVTGIEVKVDNIYKAKEIGNGISQVLGFPFFARNWEEVNKSLFKALRLERIAIAIILGFIILVAALNIVSTLTMLVMEKNKDVAILRTMGSKKLDIQKIFTIDGMIIGFIGTLLGSLAGYGICYLLKTSDLIRNLIPFDKKVYPISEFPVRIEPSYFIIVAICSLIICFIATLYPSYQASRKDPVEALRYE